MRRFVFIFLLLMAGLFFNKGLQAQVTGIGYTLSPTGEYVWWDDQAGLENSFLVGGKVGISFGQYLELRGSYMQTIDQKTDFSSFGLPNFNDSLFVSRDVDLTRWGGEFRANFSRGALLPYLIVGTGIQSIKLDGFDKNEQIYVSGGLGITLSAGDRFTLNVEAKNTQYNFTSIRNLLTEDDRNLFDIDENDFGSDRLGNWSVSAALQIYLGGRRPNQISELDEAYFKTFSGGVSGLSVPLEPTLARMNFDNKSNLRDTWMGGGYAGFNFGPYVGVRGFYLRAMENGDVGLDFDPLAMYGGEVRFRLNTGGGFSPFLMIGGGYMDVGNDYVGRDSALTTDSQPFALGGAGVNIPLSDRIKLIGGVRANLTSDTDVEDLESTESVKTHWQYNFGLNLILGKKANNPDDIVNRKVNTAVDAKQLEMEQKLAEKEAQNEAEAAKLKTEYEQKVADLESELNMAYQEADAEKAADLLKEKEVAEEVVAELEAREVEKQAKKEEEERKKIAIATNTQSGQPQNTYNNGSIIQMTPAELQNLLEEVLESTQNNAQPQYTQLTPEQQATNRRLEELERQLQQRNSQLQSENISPEQEKMNARLEELERQLQQRNGQLQSENISPEQAQMNARLAEIEKLLQENNQQSATERNQNAQNAPTQQQQEMQKQMEQQMAEMRKLMQEMQRDMAASNKTDADKIRNEKQTQQQRELNERMQDLERMLRQNGNQDININLDGNEPNNNYDASKATEIQARMLVEIEKLNERIETQNEEIEDLKYPGRKKDKKEDKTTEGEIQTPVYQTVTEENRLNIQTSGEFLAEPDTTKSRLSYEGASGYAGANFGGQASAAIGLRWHYGLADSKWELMPEAFFGFGKSTSYGLTANAILPLPVKDTPVTPYFGAGLGFIDIENDLKFNYSFIVGTYLSLGKGRVYVDYTARNFFDYNQVALGYRFKF